MRRIKVFLFNGIMLTFASLIIRTASMFFNVYISNKIGAEAVGVYSLIMSVYLFGITIANSGINLATTRIVSEQDAFSMEVGIKKAMKKCLIYSFIMGSIACILLYTLSESITINFLHGKVSSYPLKILAVSLPFLAISYCVNGYFSGLRKVKKTVYAQVLQEFLKISLISFFINQFMPNGIEYICISLVTGATLSEIFSFLVLIFLYIRDKRRLLNTGYSDTNYNKQILRIALPISFTSYIRSGLSCIKNMIIPIRLQKYGLSTDIALSQYGIINGMVMPLIMFPCSFITSFSSLLITEFSYMNVRKEQEKMNYILNKILKYCFLFSFLIMGLFLCFAKELNQFIYPETEVTSYIKILCPLIVLMYVDNVVDSILKGIDKQVLVMGINIIDLISSILLIWFLLPIFSVKGYIIVLFVSEILNGVLSLILLIKETKLKLDFNNIIIKPVSCILILNIIFSKLIKVNSIYDLIIYMIIFTLLYFTLLTLLKAIIKSDIKFLKTTR